MGSPPGQNPRLIWGFGSLENTIEDHNQFSNQDHNHNNHAPFYTIHLATSRAKRHITRTRTAASIHAKPGPSAYRRGSAFWSRRGSNPHMVCLLPWTEGAADTHTPRRPGFDTKVKNRGSDRSFFGAEVALRGGKTFSRYLF
jgi:hypothetical protein